MFNPLKSPEAKEAEQTVQRLELKKGRLSRKDQEMLDKAREITRREALRRITVIGMGSVAVLGTGVLVGRSEGCSSKKTSKKGKNPERIKDSFNRIEFPYDSDIQIPEFEMSDKEIPAEKPVGLELEQDKFVELSKVIAGKIIKGFKESLLPSLSSAQNQQQKNRLIQFFITQTAGLIEQTSPEVQKSMLEFVQTWNKDPYSLVNQINKFIRPAGYYMHLANFGDENVKFNIYEIGRSASIVISDNHGSENIPITILKNGIIEDTKSKVGYELATCGYGFSEALLFEDRIEGFVSDLIRIFSESAKEKVDFKKIKQAFTEDFLRHESTHIFLAKRFPKTGPVLSKNVGFKLPLQVNLGNNKYANLSRIVAPVMLQEVAGVGMQIAKSTIEFPYEIKIYLADIPAEKDAYSLAMNLLPLVTIECLMPQVEAFYQTLVQTGEINKDKLKELIDSGVVTKKQSQRVGEILYKLAYTFLRKAEKGELEQSF